MPKFAKQFKYRDPMTSVTYPAGWEGRLPMERYQAARAAGAFVADEEAPPVADQPDVATEPSTDAE